MSARVPYANLGVEDRTLAGGGPTPRHPAAPGPVLRLTRAWEALVEDPPWPLFDKLQGLVPWLSTDDAAAEAQRRGLAYAGAPPAVVRAVHDKAFAVRTARDKGLDEDVADLAVVLEANEVSAGRIRAIADEWPRWAWRDFTVKPRWGTSGRGRVAGKNGVVRLGARIFERGAVVEPWLDRAMDLSSLWFIDEHGEPHLLGVTLPKMREAGVYLGCDVVVTSVGLMAGTHWDERAIEKARVLVEAAAAAGLTGPCGVDAFVWRDEGGALHLRGAVELNARFTAGHVALALVQQRAAAPGARFRFRLDHDELIAPA